MIRDLRDAIRRWDDHFGTDDARLWAEVFGIVFAPGLFVRAAVHVQLALAADHVRDEHVDPHLADRDVTLRSPVQGVRRHRIEPAARVTTAVVGGLCWAAWPPAVLGGVVGLWLGANWCVAMSDPAQFVVVRLRMYRAQTAQSRQTQ